MLSYKFRIYPSKTVKRTLLKNLELCRWLYNRLLKELNDAKEEGRKLRQKDTQALIVRLKTENTELNGVYSKVLQMVNYQLWSNVRALSGLKKNGKNIGKLRFKGKGWFKTLNYNQSGFRLANGKLVLSKIGSIPIVLHREIEEEKIKGIIIKRYQSGKWYAIFQVDDEPRLLPKTDKVIGIDVGIKHFLTDSEGRQVENPKLYEKTLAKIQVLQRSLSRKKKGSRNREKVRIKLARVYEKITNQRDDFLHKLSRYYINNYDVVCVEDLKITNMVRNHSLAQRILDASWGKLIKLLSYKAERAGRIVVKVPPKGTSEGLTYEDPYRDFISANRIRMRGWDGPETPVERGPLLHIPMKAVIVGQAFSRKQEATCESGG